MARYEVEDYMSDTPPVRIIGTECENSTDNVNLKKDNASCKPTLTNLEVRHVDNFILNGARIYADCGHLEYATPECPGPWQATAADHAGMTIVADIVNRQNAKDHREGALPAIRLTGSYHHEKKIIETSGYHENFMTINFNRYKSVAMVRSVLGSYLASRIIWNGNGFVTDDYLLSQKAPGIGQEVLAGYGNQTVAGKKPLGSLFETAHDKCMNGWMLLEVRSADSHMSRRATFLSLAATSLMLRLLEQKRITHENAGDFIVRFPVTALHQINESGNLKEPLLLASGKKTTALEHQRRFAEAAMNMIEKVQLPDDEVLGAQEWIRTLDKLDKIGGKDDDVRSLAPYVEWAGKLCLLRKAAGDKMFGDEHQKAISLDRKWHSLAEGNGEMFWRRVDPMHAAFGPDIDTFGSIPPLTRAFARASLLESERCVGAGWGYVDVQKHGTKKVKLNDPFSADVPA